MKIIKYCLAFCLTLFFNNFHTAVADTGIDGTATSSSSFTLTGPVYISSLTVNSLSASGNISFSSTSLYGVVGSSTNDNAASWNVGEYMSGYGSGITCGGNGIVTTITSVPLTAGDWDVSGIVQMYANGSTFPSSPNYWDIALSKISGNSTADWVEADNVSVSLQVQGFQYADQAIPDWRVSLSTPTTIYLKGYNGTYTGNNPIFWGRISARRAR